MLFQYGFHNPDLPSTLSPPTHCWADATVTSPNATHPNFVITRGSDPTPPTQHAVNVTQQFITWFKWGFAIAMTVVIGTCCCGGCLAIGLVMESKEAVLGVAGMYFVLCITLVFMNGGMAWLIAGSVMRWRKAG